MKTMIPSTSGANAQLRNSHASRATKTASAEMKARHGPPMTLVRRNGEKIDGCISSSANVQGTRGKVEKPCRGEARRQDQQEPQR